MRSRSGETVELSFGGYSARIGTIGATLRGFAVGGIDVAWCDPPGDIVRGSKGQVLAPWPNRLEDGHYGFSGVDAEAPIDEPRTNCAIHGLVRWLDWSIEARESDRVLLQSPLGAQPAYPFLLELTVEYRLGESGLEVTTEARNADDRAIPFALGFHPYLVALGESIDSGAVVIPGRSRLALDERGLPRSDHEGLALDWVAGERVELAGRVLDDCFTDCDLVEGRWQTRFWPDTNSDRSVAIWAEQAFGYVMCYTADTLAAAERRRGIAIEPMTAPPNALKTGTSLVSLAPGATFRASWGIAA